MLYRWSVEGWVSGTVAGCSRAAGFSQVVQYGSTSSLWSAVVPSLLDAASHGPTGRWVLLLRALRYPESGFSLVAGRLFWVFRLAARAGPDASG